MRDTFISSNQDTIIGVLSDKTRAAPWSSAIGLLLISNYGTLNAAVQFDRAGTTRIGKYLLNHSFKLPGFITTMLKCKLRAADCECLLPKALTPSGMGLDAARQCVVIPVAELEAQLPALSGNEPAP